MRKVGAARPPLGSGGGPPPRGTRVLGKALPYALAGAPTLTSIFLKTFTGPPRAGKWTWRPAASLLDAMNRGAKIMPQRIMLD